MGDPTAPDRIAVYKLLMRLWWVVRWARYLYEVPRGLDARLVERPPSWLDETQRQYAHALAQAEHAIDEAD